MKDEYHCKDYSSPCGYIVDNAHFPVFFTHHSFVPIHIDIIEKDLGTRIYNSMYPVKRRLFTMKKLYACILLTVSCTLSAKAPLSIRNKPVYAGGEVVLESLAYSVNDGAKNDTTDSYPVMGLGAFYDMYYLRTGLHCTFNAGKGTVHSDYNEIDGDAIDYTLKFISIEILGKYPLNAKGIEAWPAVGIQYSANIEATDASGDDLDDSKLSDLYLLLGAGFDYTVDSSIVLSPAALFGLNLTPEPRSDVPETNDHSGYRFVIRIAVGFLL